MLYFKKLSIFVLCLAFASMPVSAFSANSKAVRKNTSHASANHRMFSPQGIYNAHPNAAIPDDTYNGTIASMTCSTIDTTTLVPAGSTVANVFVVMNVTHSYVGDLTVKLQAPDNTVLTILNRPGSAVADNGTNTPAGAATSAENMGSTIGNTQTICTDDGLCTYAPAPGSATTPPSTFSDLIGKNSRGAWKLCIADSGATDTGTFISWTMNLSSAVQASATPNGAIPEDGYTGGFNNAGQVCSTINTAGTLPSGTTADNIFLDINIVHTYVGDLTIKLQSPTGTILTILNRPGSNAPDNGTGNVGNGANWDGSIRYRDGAATSAESLGNGLGTNTTICTTSGPCEYSPAPDTATTPPTNFAAFNGQNAVGTWTLCVGDSSAQDTGTLRAWTINFPNALVPSAAGVPIEGRVLTSLGTPVRGSIIRLVGSDGVERIAMSNPFGYYRFTDVPSGENYLLTASAKNKSFASRVVSVDDAISDLDIIAEP